MIIQTQPMITWKRVLEILITKCMQLVVKQITKLKSLTSTQIHGQQKLPSRIVQCTLKFFKFSNYLIVKNLSIRIGEPSVFNFDFWWLL